MPTKHHLEKMQTARAAALTHQSPRARGQEKVLLALRWIYRWGWSSPSLVEKVAKDNRNGLIGRLVKQGLVNKTPVAAGGLRDVPVSILTLTEAGVAQVEKCIQHENDLLPYNLNPLRIPAATLRHDLLAQRVTAKAFIAEKIIGFLTPSELQRRSEKGTKQPDAVWLKDGLRMALEVELSAKWSRALDQFVAGYVAALSGTTTGEQSRFDQLLLLSDSPAILARYKKAISPGANFGVWQKDDSRHWVQIGTRKVPASVEGKLICKLIETE